MNWAEAIEEGMPNPTGTGAEPTSLRRAIVDELADHLECALERERATGKHADDAAVQAAVIERFGDPAKVARQLFLQAMRGRIMVRRIGVAALAVLAAGSIGMCVLLWQSLGESRATNQAILAQLATLGVAASNPPTLADWSALTVRCERAGGPAAGGAPIPAPGMEVSLHGKPLNETETLQLTEKSNEEGIVSFDRIRPGRYSLLLVMPGAIYQEQVVLFPGRPRSIAIACPEPPALADCAFRLEVAPREGVPDNPSLRVLVGLEPVVTDYLSGTKWSARKFGIVVDRAGRSALFEGGVSPTLTLASVCRVPEGKYKIDWLELTDSDRFKQRFTAQELEAAGLEMTIDIAPGAENPRTISVPAALLDKRAAPSEP